MASTEKSAAWTESCPMKPLAMQEAPGFSSPVLRKIIPDTELFRVLINSEKTVC